MTLNEIYNLKPIDISYSFSPVANALKNTTNNEGHDISLSALLNQAEYGYEDSIEAEKRFETKTYMSEGDDKWGANLYAVFFDGTPIMLVKNDGRYYEQYDTYLSNLDVFEKAQAYIESKLSISNKPSFTDVNEDIEDLAIVNSYNLNDYYDANLIPQYKENDVVWAWVQENHLSYDWDENNKGYVLTKVEINRVNPTHPQDTYFGMQIERGWGEGFKDMRLYAKSRGIGASFNDDMIVGLVHEIDMPSLAINNFVDENGLLPDDYKMEKPMNSNTKKLSI